MRLAYVVVVPLILAGLVPYAVAQTPVEECRKECDPKDLDVNGDVPRSEGPVRVFLYADLLELGWYLSTRHPSRSATGPFFVDSAGDCGVAVWPTRHVFGFASDLDLAGPATAYVYVERADGTQDAIDVPVTLHVQVDLVSEEKVEPVADGTSEPFGRLLSEGSTTWEVPVNLTLHMDTIPAWDPHALGELRVTFRLCAEHADAGAPQQWRMVSAPHLPNRLILNVSNPLEPDRVSGWVEYGQLCAGGAVVPPFGQYDVDYTNATAQVVWDDNVIQVNLQEGLRLGVSYPGANVPSSLRGCTPVAGPADGQQVLIRTATPNRQGTVVVVQETTVEWDADEAVEVPGAAALPFLVVLLTIAVVRRRAMKRHQRPARPKKID